MPSAPTMRGGKQRKKLCFEQRPGKAQDLIALLDVVVIGFWDGNP